MGSHNTTIPGVEFTETASGNAYSVPGNSTAYGWKLAADSPGVLWTDTHYSVLENCTSISFDDISVELGADGSTHMRYQGDSEFTPLEATAMDMSMALGRELDEKALRASINQGVESEELEVQLIPNQLDELGAHVSFDVGSFLPDEMMNAGASLQLYGMPPGLAYNAARMRVEGTVSDEVVTGQPYTVDLKIYVTGGRVLSSSFSWTIRDAKAVDPASMNTMAVPAVNNREDASGAAILAAVAANSALAARAFSLARSDSELAKSGKPKELDSSLAINSAPLGSAQGETLSGGEGNDELIGLDSGVAERSSGGDPMLPEGAELEGLQNAISQNAAGATEDSAADDNSSDGPGSPSEISSEQAATEAGILPEEENTIPFAGRPSGLTTLEDTRRDNIDLLASAFDIDGDILTVTSASAENGVVSLNANGVIDYIPNSRFSGVDVITYTVDDGRGGTDTASFNVTVVEVNDAPVLGQVADQSVDEDGVITTIDVLALASDEEGEPLFVSTATALHGVVMVGSDGTLEYRPNPNYFGTDTIRYTIQDAGGEETTAFISVVVNSINDVPDAGAVPTAAAAEDTQLQGIEVLSFASDVDGDVVSVIAGSGISARGGAVTINPDGTIDYTPPANFFGIDTITYQVSDGQTGGQSTGSFDVTVAPVNDAPDLPVLPGFDINEDTPLGALDLLQGATDVDLDSLSIVSVTGVGGVASINPDGSVSFVPVTNYNGPASIEYVVSDGTADPLNNSSTQTVLFNILPVNDAPVPAALVPITTQEDVGVATIDVLTGVTDVEMDLVTVTPGTQATQEGGSVTVNPDGTLSYTPPPGFSGVDRIPYQLDDGNAGGLTDAFLDINVTPVNDAPALDLSNVQQDVFNSSFAPTAPGDWAGWTETGTFANSGAGLAAPAHIGDVPGIGATLTQSGLTGFASGPGAFAAAVVKVDIGWNHAGNNFGSSQQLSLSIGGVVYATVTTPDGGGASASVAFLNGASGTPAVISDSPYLAWTYETLEVNLPASVANTGDLQLTWTNIPGGSAQFDDISIDNVEVVRAADVQVDADTQTTYVAGDSAVSIVDASGMLLDEDSVNLQSASVVLTNTQAGDALVIAGAALGDGDTGTVNGIGYTVSVVGQLTTLSLSGAATPSTYLAALQQIGFENISANPSAGNRTITFQVSDGAATSNVATSTVTVEPQLTAPQSAADTATVLEDAVSMTVNVLGNDTAGTNATDPTSVMFNVGGNLQTSLTVPGEGVWSVDPISGLVEFVPVLDFNGTTSPVFYSVADVNGFRSLAQSIELTITPVNDAPMLDLSVAAPGTDYTVTFSEGAGAVSIAGPDVLAADTATNENNQFQSITITLDSVPDGNDEQLIVLSNIVSLGSDSSGSVAISGVPLSYDYIAATRTLTIVHQGGVANPITGAQVEDVLESITYNNLNTSPITGDRTATITIRDLDDVVSDSLDSNSATTVITVSATNNAPTDITYPSAVVAENASAPTVVATFNAVDPDNPFGPFTYSLPFGSALFEISGNQLVVRTGADINFEAAASHSVIVQVSDGSQTYQEVVLVTVTDQPEAPVANPLIGTTVLEDAPALSLDLLLNATDPDGDVVTIVPGSVSAANGTIVPNGALFDYTPAPDFNGSDTITYSITDGTGYIVGATITVVITAVNDAPLIDLDLSGPGLNFATTFVEGGGNAVVVDGDVSVTDIDGSIGSIKVDFTTVYNSGNEFLDLNGTAIDLSSSSIQTVTIGGSDFTADYSVATGELIITDALGGLILPTTAETILSTLSYVNTDEAPDLTDRIIEFTVTDQDGLESSPAATSTISVFGVNDAPLLGTVPAVATNEDVTIGSIDVLTPASDLESDTVSVVNDASLNAANGTVTLNPDGTLNYTPDPDYFGSDTIFYTLTDGNGGQTTGTVDVTVNSVNDAPVITPLATITTIEDITISAIDVLGPLNASDVDGDALFVVDDATLTANFGTVSVTPTGEIQYIPDPNANTGINGLDTVTYTISDGSLTTSGSFQVDVVPADDRPVLDLDASNGGSANYSAVYNENAGQQMFADIDLSVVDVEDQIRSIEIVHTGVVDGADERFGISASSIDLSSSFIGGTATYDFTFTAATSTIVFTPTPSTFFTVAEVEALLLSMTYEHTSEDPTAGDRTFTVRLEDGVAGNYSAPVVGSLTVVPAADAPDAVSLSATVAEDQTYIFDVLAAATDVDGTPDVASVTIVGAPGAGKVLDDVGRGQWTVNDTNGEITFTPDADFNGIVPDIQFQFRDDEGNLSSSSPTLSLTVAPVNDAPSLGVVTPVVTDEDTALTTIDVVGPASDPEGDALSVVDDASLSALNGTVTVNPDGTLQYTPNANYFGSDTISYTLTDGNAVNGETSGTVSVTVNAVNDAPVLDAVPTQLTDEDVAIASIDVLSGASDVELDALSVVNDASLSALNGTVTLNPDGSLRYVPNADYFGPDTISYTLTDGNAINGQASGTIDVTVNATSDVPVIDLDVSNGGSVNYSATYLENSGQQLFVNGDLDVVDIEDQIRSIEIVHSGTTDGVSEMFRLGLLGFSLNTNGSGSGTISGINFQLSIDAVSETVVVTPDGNPFFTAAEVETLLLSATYEHTSEDPTAGDRTFTIRLEDGVAGDYSAPVIGTLTVVPTADAPQGLSQTATVNEDNAYIFDTLNGATDVDGIPDVASVTIVGAPGLGKVLDDPGRGQWTVNDANGEITFTPVANFNGVVAPIQYEFRDDEGNLAISAPTLSLTVDAVNDAPTIGGGNLSAVSEDTVDPVGETVLSLIGGTFADVDAGSSLSGIAVTSNTASSVQGVWQYSTDGATSWFDVGPVGANGLALSESTLIRFLPTENFNGAVDLISIRGLDDSYGGGFTAGGARVLVDTSSPGGSSPVSSSLTNISTSVISVNDTPTDITSDSSFGTSINVAGNADYYQLFDGDFQNAPGAPAAFGGRDAFTVEMQFTISSTVDQNVTPLLNYFVGTPVNNDEVVLEIQQPNSTAALKLEIGGTTIFNAASAAPLLDGQPHTVSLSWDNTAGDWVLYIDGSVAGSGTGLNTGNTIAPNGVLVFGQEQDSVGGDFTTSEFFSGTYQDIRFFDDVRTPAEIAASAGTDVLATEPGLTANWQFGNLDGGDVVSTVVTGGTLLNSSVVDPDPQWVSGGTVDALYVLENAAPSTVVATLSSLDIETTNQSNFSYSVSGGNGNFAISGDQLIVSPGATLDFETDTFYDIDITVTDDGTPPESYVETFRVLVGDVGDIPVLSLTTNFGSNRSVGWAHNNGTNDATPQILDLVRVSGAGDLVTGSGLSTDLSSTIVEFSNADTPNVLSAITANDFVSYEFTAGDTDALTQFRYSSYSYAGDYKMAVLISDNNFSSFDTLIEDHQFVAANAFDFDVMFPSGEYLVSRTVDVPDYALNTGTDYQVRVYFYDVLGGGPESLPAGTGVFDDFSIDFTGTSTNYADVFYEAGANNGLENGDPVGIVDASTSVVSDAQDDIVSISLAVSGLGVASSEELVISGFTFNLGADQTQLGIVHGSAVFDANYVAATQTVTFTNNAGAGVPITASEWNLLIGSITYDNLEAGATAGTRTFDFVATDGAGNVSATASSLVNVVPNLTPAPVTQSVVFGTPDIDFLNLAPDTTYAYAQGDDDIIAGSNGNNIIHGQDGADSISGGAGNDTIFGDRETVVADNFGSNTLLTQTIINEFGLGVQSAPVVVSLNDGTLLVVWYEDAFATTTGGAVFGRIVQPNGSAVSSAFQIGTSQIDTDNNLETLPLHATLMTDGNVFVSWNADSSSNPDLSGNAAVGSIVNVTAMNAGPEILLNSTESGDQSAAIPIALSDGSVFVVWHDNAAGDDLSMVVRGQFVGADGSLIGPEINIGTAPVEGGNARDMPPLTAELLASGDIIVAWSTNDSAAVDGPNSSAVVSVIVDAGTMTAGPQSVVNTTTTTNQSGPVVVALSAGGALVVWYDGADLDSTATTQLRGQLLNNDGSLNGTEFSIGTSSVEGLDRPAMPRIDAIELADGNVLVGWQSEGIINFDGDSTTVLGSVVDASTQTAGTQFVINSTTSTAQSAPVLTALHDGRVFAVWYDDSDFDNTGNVQVRGQFLNTNGSLNGTEFLIGTADVELDAAIDMPPLTATLTANGDVFIAWQTDNNFNVDSDSTAVVSTLLRTQTSGGTDTITGDGGSDTIFGGQGDDLLYGGADDDTIDGGAGADTIDGGTGNDTVSYASASSGVDVLLSGADASGIDGAYGNDFTGGKTGDAAGDSYSSIENFIGSSFNDRVYGATVDATATLGAGDDVFDNTETINTSDTVFGQAGNDLIITGDGDDFLFGGDNNDTLYAEEGDDLLSGGSGVDNLIGGAGNDILDGGADLDQATYSGVQADYDVMDNLNGIYTVTDLRSGSPDGTDTLVDVERISFSGLNTTISSAVTSVSPIALDLNQDGEIGVTGETTAKDKSDIETLGSTVEFDMNGDGDLETIEWLDGSGDALLVNNADGQALADMNGTRLFGDQSGTYEHGYQQLAEWDTDRDGKISGDETEGLNLWIDDGDAQVQEGELFTLEDMGVTEINLELEQGAQDAEGRDLFRSSATLANGERILTEDVWFGRDISDDDERLIRPEPVEASKILEDMPG